MQNTDWIQLVQKSGRMNTLC